MADTTRRIANSLLITTLLLSIVVGLLTLPDQPAVGFDGAFLSSFFLGQVLIWGGFLALRFGLPRVLSRLSQVAQSREDQSSRLSSH